MNNFGRISESSIQTEVTLVTFPVAGLREGTTEVEQVTPNWKDSRIVW